MAAINFPSDPIEEQAFNVAPGKSFVFRSGVWCKAPVTTALPKNYIVNPTMSVSQENTNTAATTNGHHAADQWFTIKNHSIGTITTQRVQVGLTPQGTPDRFRITITAADTALISGEYLGFQQDIEGQRIADLRFGSASPTQTILRFGFRGPAGTYAIALRNYPATHSYIALFTVAAGEANSFTTQTFIIPGPTVGTWLTNNGKGMSLNVTLAWGGSNGAGWQSGEFTGAAGMTNGMGTLGSVFELFDVGLYADPYKTGIAPPFEIPFYDIELRRCKRYWYRSYLTRGWVASGTVVTRMGQKHPVPMRATPSWAVVGAPPMYDLTTATTATAVQGTNNSNDAYLEVNFTVAATLVVGRTASHYLVADTSYVAVSARM